MIKNVWRKKPGKMYNVYWLRSYTHTFFFCFFILTSFNITPLKHLVKVILIRSCESVQGEWFRQANACASGQALFWSKINSVLHFIYWASIYLLKVTDESTRCVSEICWKLTIKTPDFCHWRRSGVLIFNSKHISQLAVVYLLFLLLLWTGKIPTGY